MSGTFADRVEADRRLFVLQMLAELDSGSANERALTTGLRGMNEDVTIDQVRSLLSWLGGVRLVNVIQLADSSYSATITQRGYDVAHGRSSIPGVSRKDRI